MRSRVLARRDRRRWPPIAADLADRRRCRCHAERSPYDRSRGASSGRRSTNGCLGASSSGRVGCSTVSRLAPPRMRRWRTAAAAGARSVGRVRSASTRPGSATRASCPRSSAASSGTSTRSSAPSRSAWTTGWSDPGGRRALTARIEPTFGSTGTQAARGGPSSVGWTQSQPDCFARQRAHLTASSGIWRWHFTQRFRGIRSSSPGSSSKGASFPSAWRQLGQRFQCSLMGARQ